MYDSGRLRVRATYVQTQPEVRPQTMKYTETFPAEEVAALRDALAEVEEERAKLREQNALLCKIVGVAALPPRTAEAQDGYSRPAA